MHFLSVLVVVVATLVASTNAASTAKALDDTNLWQASSQDAIDASDTTETTTTPMLRGNRIDYDDADNDLSTNKAFLEDRIIHKLATRATRRKLYQKWYDCGFTVDQVGAELAISPNSKLYRTYTRLKRGYRHYCTSRRNEPTRSIDPDRCTEDYLARIVENETELST